MTEVLRKFEDRQDLFNPANFLTGYMDISQGDNYGQLLLTHINGMKCKEQVIYSTPKIHYPFNRLGKFYFRYLGATSPIYEKLDGTNVISYHYFFKKNKYVTYKTRLNPILSNSKFGNFFSMWKEVLEKYPKVEQYASECDINFSYELYGILNKHLIAYPIRLDIRLLFGLDYHTGEVILPDKFKGELPIIEKYGEIKPSYFFPDFYSKVKGEIEATNDYSSLEWVTGSEGRVIYIQDEEGKWKQYKCKPETIFKLHHQAGMSRNDIVTTCYNALENVELEELSYDFVVELLKEEFDGREVVSNEARIKVIMEEVKEEVQKRYKTIEVYNKLGIKLKDNKREVMRKMSELFNKKDMRYVYNIIESYEK